MWENPRNYDLLCVLLIVGDFCDIYCQNCIEICIVNAVITIKATNSIILNEISRILRLLYSACQDLLNDLLCVLLKVGGF